MSEYSTRDNQSECLVDCTLPRPYSSKAFAKMQILTLNFVLSAAGGVWQPVKWSSIRAKLLYNVYSSCIIVMILILTVTQFIDIVLVVDNVDDFVANALLFVGMFAVICKITIAITRRDMIIDLVRTLLSDPCKPRNEEEMMIQTRFDEFIRTWSIRFALLATGSVTGVTIKSVLNIMQGLLPYRVWLPYSTNATVMFWITSIHQIVSIIFATIINIATETLVFGFFLQTCAQLEILGNRLRKLTNNIAHHQKDISLPSNAVKSIMSQHIRHHLGIYNFAKRVNVVYNQVLFIQFFASVLVLCTSLYYISMHFTETESATMLVYVFCMFVQIFLYCWSGNEVILKSMSIADAAYNMDWSLLSISEKKDLLMIMKRSTVPIKFSSSFLITLSLESYCNLLKTSYSVFNVLQQS